jgi:hypothetical protein
MLLGEFQSLDSNFSARIHMRSGLPCYTDHALLFLRKLGTSSGLSYNLRYGARAEDSNFRGISPLVYKTSAVAAEPALQIVGGVWN